MESHVSLHKYGIILQPHMTFLEQGKYYRVNEQILLYWNPLIMYCCITVEADVTVGLGSGLGGLVKSVKRWKLKSL